jgi:tungstate transport system substrate-binding protein
MTKCKLIRISCTYSVDLVILIRLGLISVLVALTACAERPATPTLDVATTTSVQNSGLLEALLPHFTSATVRVHAAGSGRALEMLKDGIVDLVISHAPETEAKYVAEHPDWRYQKLAFNRFIVVGPPDDRAHAKDATSVLDAFRRIAAAPVNFVSRGDSSGTHEREQKLWKLAGVMPASDRLLTSGQGMANTLRQADEKQAYTLSDEATFWQLQRQIDLVALSEGDDLLLNTYAVIYPRAVDTAATFAEWLTRGEGRRRIDGHRIEGRVAFRVWPDACPGDQPSALPCT